MENTAKGPSLAEVLEGHFPLTSNRLLLQDITNLRQRRILALVLAPHVLLDRAAIDPLVGILRSLRGTNAIDLYVDGQGPTSPEAWRGDSALGEDFERGGLEGALRVAEEQSLVGRVVQDGSFELHQFVLRVGIGRMRCAGGEWQVKEVGRVTA